MKLSPPIAVSALVLGAIPLIALAADFQAGDTVTITASTTDLYAAGGNVDIRGPVEGDLIAAGGAVTVSAPVSSDATLAGGNVSVLAPIGDDLRAAAGTLRVSGPVEDDAIVAGGQVTLLPTATISGELVANGGQLLIESPVNGMLRANGGVVTINSEIQGDAIVKAAEVVLGQNAVIHGNLVYESPQEAELQAGAQVLGETQFTQVEESDRTGEIIGAGTAAFFLMFLALALVLLWVFPDATQGVVDRTLRSGRDFGWSFLIGLIVAIVTPIVGVILLITIIGLPIGVVILLGHVIAILVSIAFAGILIGAFLEKWVMQRETYASTWLNVIVGVLILALIGYIPFLGELICTILVLTALGALVRLRYGDWQEPKVAQSDIQA